MLAPVRRPHRALGAVFPSASPPDDFGSFFDLVQGGSKASVLGPCLGLFRFGLRVTLISARICRDASFERVRRRVPLDGCVLDRAVDALDLAVCRRTVRPRQVMLHSNLLIGDVEKHRTKNGSSCGFAAVWRTGCPYLIGSCGSLRAGLGGEAPEAPKAVLRCAFSISRVTANLLVR